MLAQALIGERTPRPRCVRTKIVTTLRCRPSAWGAAIDVEKQILLATVARHLVRSSPPVDASPLSRRGAGMAICSWPFEVTGTRPDNVATQGHQRTTGDAVDTSRWSTVIVDGRYPNARFRQCEH